MAEQGRQFHPLAITTLPCQTGYSRPFFHIQNPAKASSSALEVMTDLRFIAAGTVSADLGLETATQKMIARGVRSLLVIDINEDVIGIITSHDVEGARPAAAMQDRGIGRGQVLVRDIMTGAEDIEVLRLNDVLHARVGDIVATLKHSGRQHALVMEEESFSGKQLICGIFSASQIARQLGAGNEKHVLADTFADIDRAVSAQS